MRPVLDSQGLVSPYQDGRDSNNGLRYSLEWLVGALWSDINAPSVANFIHAAFRACEKSPGVWMRRPDNKGGIQSVDDYVSIATYSYFFDPLIAKRIVKQGKRSFWYFNNTSQFSFRGWLGRFLPFVAHVHYSADLKPSLIHTIAWLISVLASTLSNKQDSWALSWQLVIVGQNQSFLHNWVSRIFQSRMKKQWGDMRNLLKLYKGWDSPQGKLLSGQVGQLVLARPR